MPPDNDDALLCGLDGTETDPVLVSQFNRWVARAMRHHVGPLKENLSETRTLLEQHIRDEEIMLAKIHGGVKVAIWMIPVMNVLLVWILYTMHKAGML